MADQSRGHQRRTPSRSSKRCVQKAKTSRLDIYVDTSVVVQLIVDDVHTARAETMYLHNSGRILLGDFAAAAFASVISRRVRVGSLSTDEGRAAFTKLDQWMISDAYSVTMTSVDITTAPNFPRRLDLNLRAPDAVHIAICRRIGAVLANFDDKMTAAARALDVEIAAA